MLWGLSVHTGHPVLCAEMLRALSVHNGTQFCLKGYLLEPQGPLSSQWHTVLIERLSFLTVVLLGRSWACHNASTALFTSSGGLRPAVLLLDTLEDLGNFATFKDLHEPAGHELTWDEWMWHLTHSAMVISPPDQLLCQLDKGTTGELSAVREFHRLLASHCGDLWS